MAAFATPANAATAPTCTDDPIACYESVGQVTLALVLGTVQGLPVEPADAALDTLLRPLPDGWGADFDLYVVHDNGHGYDPLLCSFAVSGPTGTVSRSCDLPGVDLPRQLDDVDRPDGFFFRGRIHKCAIGFGCPNRLFAAALKGCGAGAIGGVGGAAIFRRLPNAQAIIGGCAWGALTTRPAKICHVDTNTCVGDAEAARPD